MRNHFDPEHAATREGRALHEARRPRIDRTEDRGGDLLDRQDWEDRHLIYDPSAEEWV